MCMEDVKIARSQRIRSLNQMADGVMTDVTYEAYHRRIRIVVTGTGANLNGTLEKYIEYPVVIISTDPAFTDDAKIIVRQTIVDAFVFDADKYGSILQEGFSVRYSGRDGSYGAIAEIELVVPPGSDNAFTASLPK